MTYYVIGDEDTVVGFSLAGVRGEVAQNADQAKRALDEAFSLEDIGIVIITTRVASLIRAQVDRYTIKKSFPLVIEIPDRFGPDQERESVRDMVSKAVGISV